MAVVVVTAIGVFDKAFFVTVQPGESNRRGIADNLVIANPHHFLAVVPRGKLKAAL